MRAAARLGLPNRSVARILGVSEATVSRMGAGAYLLKTGRQVVRARRRCSCGCSARWTRCPAGTKPSRAWMRNENVALGGRAAGAHRDRRRHGACRRLPGRPPRSRLSGAASPAAAGASSRRSTRLDDEARRHARRAGAARTAARDAASRRVPAECRHLHYLLSTPFRYGAPYPRGSRFRRAGFTPGVFYASQTVDDGDAGDGLRTGCCSLRIRRRRRGRPTPASTRPSRSRFHTSAGLDLTPPPFDRERARWTHPADYEALPGARGGRARGRRPGDPVSLGARSPPAASTSRCSPARRSARSRRWSGRPGGCISTAAACARSASSRSVGCRSTARRSPPTRASRRCPGCGRAVRARFDTLRPNRLCRYTHMAPALSYTGLFVLQAVAQGHRFGFDIMAVTALPSGTIYPALRRLEALELVRSDWEKDAEGAQGRPAAAALLRDHAARTAAADRGGEPLQRGRTAVSESGARRDPPAASTGVAARAVCRPTALARGMDGGVEPRAFAGTTPPRADCGWPPDSMADALATRRIARESRQTSGRRARHLPRGRSGFPLRAARPDGVAGVRLRRDRQPGTRDRRDCRRLQLHQCRGVQALLRRHRPAGSRAAHHRHRARTRSSRALRPPSATS